MPRAVVGDLDAVDAAAVDGDGDAVAPASSAFSTSSRTAAAGRSITSPAAIRLTVVSGSSRMRPARVSMPASMPDKPYDSQRPAAP